MLLFDYFMKELDEINKTVLFRLELNDFFYEKCVNFQIKPGSAMIDLELTLSKYFSHPMGTHKADPDFIRRH